MGTFHGQRCVLLELFLVVKYFDLIDVFTCKIWTFIIGYFQKFGIFFLYPEYDPNAS